jgi:hypothetical protein
VIVSVTHEVDSQHDGDKRGETNPHPWLNVEVYEGRCSNKHGDLR